MYTPFRSDLSNNMDHMRISGTGPSSVILSRSSLKQLIHFYTPIFRQKLSWQQIKSTIKHPARNILGKDSIKQNRESTEGYSKSIWRNIWRNIWRKRNIWKEKEKHIANVCWYIFVFMLAFENKKISVIKWRDQMLDCERFAIHDELLLSCWIACI